MKPILKNYTILVLILITSMLPVFLSARESGIQNPGDIQNFVTDYLSALNEGKRETMKVFLEKWTNEKLLEKIPIEMLITFNLAFFYETGGLGYDFLETDSASDHLIKIKLVNRLTQAKYVLKIPVTPAKEFRINGMVSGETPEAGKNPIQTPVFSEVDIAEKIEKCIARLEKDNEFSGVVLIAKNGQPVVKRAVGNASIAYETPNLTDTKFNLASVGKIFTGVAITQLAGQGKLKIDDTIDKYLPSGWLPNDISGKIQINICSPILQDWATILRMFTNNAKSRYSGN
jgi:hypothetical protein